MAGPYVDVTPDPARRPFAVGEFVDAHFGSQSRPQGHGFTERNRDEGTAYYVHDASAVRFITLDTACPAGGAEGCLSIDQLHWLERRLEEVHSSFRTRSGSTTRTQRQDRLVVILSHHGLDTLTNPRVHPVERGSGHVGRGELAEMLFRFGNVVLWLNGHIHTNRIQPRLDPAGMGHGGFWEVTTASLVDWPCQGRIVELYDAGDGLLARRRRCLARRLQAEDGGVAGWLADVERACGGRR